MHVPKHILIPGQVWRLYTVFLGVELYTPNSMHSLFSTELGWKMMRVSEQILHKLTEFIRQCDFQHCQNPQIMHIVDG